MKIVAIFLNIFSSVKIKLFKLLIQTRIMGHKLSHLITTLSITALGGKESYLTHQSCLCD